ncbi:MAG: VanZ family protein, partial [Terriglobales bacterium]
NDVSWAPGGWGLRFGDYGTILSGRDAVPPASKDGYCSLEIWLTPDLADDSNVILAFAPRSNPQQFRIGQNGDAVYVSRQVLRNGAVSERPYTRVGHAFQQGRPALITLTAGERGTEVYLDGKLANTRADFGLSVSDLSGRIVVANSPVGNNTWSGLLQGIAVYSSELPAQEVARHYDAWSGGDRMALTNLGSDSLYLFLEGTGKTVHNLGPSKQPDLYIPDHYMILYPTFLQPFWKDFYLSASGIRDMTNNVLAFVPLGFLLSAWLARRQSRRGSFWYAVLLGGLVSLTIEILQYFIPMRDSDTLDLLLNTAGTMVGAWLYVLEADNQWLEKAPIIGRVWRGLRPVESSAGKATGSALPTWHPTES